MGGAIYHINALSVLMIATISCSLSSHTHEHIRRYDDELRLGLPCAMLCGFGHTNVVIVGHDEMIALLLQRAIASSTFELNFLFCWVLVIDHVMSCYSLSLLVGMHCTCHRVFLATLIVAAKYLNDQSPKNKHWSAHSQIFSVGEVNLMEKQLLSLLVSAISPLSRCYFCMLHDGAMENHRR